MDGKPDASDRDSDAAEYLKQTEGDFTRSQATGLYAPKADHPTGEVDVHVDALIENPPSLRRPLGSVQDAASNRVNMVAMRVQWRLCRGIALKPASFLLRILDRLLRPTRRRKDQDSDDCLHFCPFDGRAYPHASP
jgi:hypothetical protein